MVLFNEISYGEPGMERKRQREKERDKCLEWPISRVLSFNASSDPAAETSAHKERRKAGKVGIKNQVREI